MSVKARSRETKIAIWSTKSRIARSQTDKCQSQSLTHVQQFIVFLVMKMMSNKPFLKSQNDMFGDKMNAHSIFPWSLISLQCKIRLNMTCEAWWSRYKVVEIMRTSWNRSIFDCRISTWPFITRSLPYRAPFFYLVISVKFTLIKRVKGFAMPPSTI